MVIDVILFIIGLMMLLKLSPYVVTYSTKLAELLQISPMIIGIIAIAIGTSIPEMTTSVTASIMGHGDINVGDIMGSTLSQITLIFGLSVLISGTVRTERKNLFLLGSGMIISTIIAYSIIEKGYISRMNGITLIIVYIAIYYIVGNSLTKKQYIQKEDGLAFKTFWKRYVLFLALSLGGVLLGSTLLVNSVISLSKSLNVPEYIVSFVAVGLGTSLPELFVGISAIKKGEHELFIGDIIGSNITDVTLSLGLGPLIRPNVIESELITKTGSYVILVSIIVTLIFGIKKKIDRKTALLLIILYLISFVLIR